MCPGTPASLSFSPTRLHWRCSRFSLSTAGPARLRHYHPNLFCELTRLDFILLIPTFPSPVSASRQSPVFPQNSSPVSTVSVPSWQSPQCFVSFLTMKNAQIFIVSSLQEPFQNIQIKKRVLFALAKA